MTLNHVIRAFTLIGILGSIVLTGAITYEYFDSASLTTNIIQVVAFCPVFLGVVSSYLVQAEHLGRFGLFSFVVLTVGFILSSGLSWAVAFVSPVYGELTATNTVQATVNQFPILQGMASTFIVLILGMLLYGIVILRSSKIAKWSGLMFLLSVAGALAPPMDDKCIYFFCAGIIWIGVKAWKRDPTNEAITSSGTTELGQQKTVPFP
jgi:hypothetical protein